MPMGTASDRCASRQAARAGAALALGLLAAVSLTGCNSRAHQPIPIASAADLPAPVVPAAEATAVAAPAPAVATQAEPASQLAALPMEPGVPDQAEEPARSDEPAEPSFETATPADPDKVMGLGREEIQALLGKPGLVRREAPAEVWQYESRGCVLDIFLYEQSAELAVVYVEARDGQAAAAATGPCLGAVMDDHRQLLSASSAGGTALPL